MSTDLIEQLTQYGELLRAEIDTSLDRQAQLRLASTADAQGSSEREPTHGPRHRLSRSGLDRRAVLVTVMLLVGLIGASIVVAVSNRSQPITLATALVTPDAIERRATDTPAFLARLDAVDYEMEILPPREPTETERAALVAFFEGQDFEILSATIRFALPSGWMVAEVETTPTDDELGTTRCGAIAQVDGDGLRITDGFSCWNPATLVVPGSGDPATYSYGCRPDVEFAGLVALGKRDFTAEVFLPPDAPGVILTLDSGDTLLLRPVDDQVFFAGPIVDRIEVFYADGSTDQITTADCR